jgi:hypothetical protein
MAKRLRRQHGVPIRTRVRHGFIRVGNKKIAVPPERIYTAQGGKAFLMVIPTTQTTRKGWVKVSRSMVDFKHRRKGLMTRLYEVAAEEACQDGNRLVSDANRSAFAEAFWRKQKRKGNARCLERNVNRQDNVWYGPLNDFEEYLAQKYRDPLYGDPDYDRAAREMKKLKLPRARRGYWPCFRWGFKKKMCREPRPFNLSGL